MEVCELMKLNLVNINKTFDNDGKELQVLNNINLSVSEGEFVTLLGPSGCGKTTLLTIVAGFQPANSGEIYVNNAPVKGPGPDRGFVFQNYALFPWMTVRDNILFPMKQIKMEKNQREELLDELLELSQLKGKEKLYPHQISGGMKQRTSVVRALATKPEVLLMDEPLGALDFQMRKNLQKEIEAIWLKEKTTVLMVTHDIDEAVYLSDRVVVMSTDKGRVLLDLNVDLDRPRDRKTKCYKEYTEQLTSILSEA